MRMFITIRLLLLLMLNPLNANQVQASRNHAGNRGLIVPQHTAKTDSVMPALRETQNRLQNEYRHHIWLLYGVAALFFTLSAALGLYIYKTRKRLVAADLKQEESQQVNEAYVGGFLEISLQYIERFDNYQKLIRRKVKAGQTADLLKAPLLDREKDEEELYRKFDQTFLHLFPHFVDELNSLLKPEERFALKDGEPLSTELRMIALIRLGITDSNKIAAFLHYSLRTIYNYRSQFRKKVRNEDMDMEKAVTYIR